MTTNPVEFECDMYKRAFKVAYDALMVIANYGGRTHEDYLRDHGVPVRFMAEKSETHYEYLRRMDTEVAEQAVHAADDIIRKLKAE